MKKINVDKLKEFLFNHGEKVALGTCAALALLLGTLGILNASSASRDKSGIPWVKALDDGIQAVNRGIQAAPLPKLDEKTTAQLNEAYYVWKPWESNYQSVPYSQISELSLDKRDNPSVLPVRPDEKDKKYFQFDYYRALVFSHEYSRTEATVKAFKEGSSSTAIPWVKKAEARRMLVVTGVYPLREELKRFKDSLRYKSVAELLAVKEDLPQFAGITVIRYELTPGPDGKLVPADPKGEPLKGEPLVEYRDKEHIIISDSLNALLKDAIYDEKVAESLEPYIFAGLTMPMPKIGNGLFGRLNLPGITVMSEDGTVAPEKKRDPSAIMPKKDSTKPGGFFFQNKEKKDTTKLEEKKLAVAAEDLATVNLDKEKISASLYRRLFPDLKSPVPPYNIYHILGEFMPADNDPNQKGVGGQPLPNQAKPRFFAAWDVAPPKANQPAVGANPPPAAQAPEFDRDAIVRFIDPDVKPGKSYQYAIQVWIRNPNYRYKDPDKVQFAGLMLKEDLNPSPFTTTPTYTIPQEYGIYAVDQQLLDDWVATGRSEIKGAKDHTTFQVHQWIKTGWVKDLNNEVMIGDWAIAERIDVRKGDPIGLQVFVRVPCWKQEKDGFEMYGIKDKKSLPGFRTNLQPPVEGDNTTTPGYPVLVDFTGGKRINAANAKLEEEAAVEALVLMPNGKLQVLNSRNDSDSKERKDHLELTHRRNERFYVPVAPKGPGGG